MAARPSPPVRELERVTMHALAAQLRMVRLLANDGARELVLAEDRGLRRPCVWSRPGGDSQDAQHAERILAWARTYSAVVQAQRATLPTASEANFAELNAYFDDRGPNLVFSEPEGTALEARLTSANTEPQALLGWLEALGAALQRLHASGIAHGRVAEGAVVNTGGGVHWCRPLAGAVNVDADARAFRKLTARAVQAAQTGAAGDLLLSELAESAGLRESVAQIAVARERTSTPPPPAAASRVNAGRVQNSRRASVLALVKTRRLQNWLLALALVVIAALVIAGRGTKAPAAADLDAALPSSARTASASSRPRTTARPPSSPDASPAASPAERDAAAPRL